MSLYDVIQADIKDAMLNKNPLVRDCLRTLVSDVKNMTVNAGKDIMDDAVIKCVQKAVKQHNDSITQFETANRIELVEKEKAELIALSKYLPKMLSEDETRQIIDNILQSIEAIKKNMGIIMKQLPKDVDRKIASRILNEILK